MHSQAAVVGVLFLRTLDRSERIYRAMTARGFDGRMGVAHAERMRAADWLFAIAAVAAATGIVAWDRILYG